MTTKIGMITPSSNTCLEPCTYGLLSGTSSITVHFTRIPVTRIALDGASDEQFDSAAMAGAAQLLADAHVDVIAWNGTAGSWLGIEHDRAICSVITDATGVPSTTSTLAVLDACRALGVRRIGLVTPYTADIVGKISTEFAHVGIEIASESHCGLTDNRSFAATSTATVDDMVRSVASDVEAVVILCTNVDGTMAARTLECELGIPVIDSVLATAWAAIRTAQPRFASARHGELLLFGSLRADLQDAIDTLRAVTKGDRATLRIDLPELGLCVQTAAAESCGAGIKPIRSDTSLPQRQLNTVMWLEESRKTLVQNDFAVPPEPPVALREVYGVAAQVLCPVEIGAEMSGWISVHSVHERMWAPDDVTAIEATALSITELVRTHQENQ